MAKSPLQTAYGKWAQRTAQARQRGIPDSVIAPLAQYDMKKVEAGGTGMTDQEAMLALVSAGQGSPVIQDPKQKHGLFDILGNVPSDVTGIVKGFIPGMIHDVSHIGQLPGALAHAGGEIAGGKYAQGVQDIAKAPGLGTLLLAGDLIPFTEPVALPLTAAVYGADVAAKATTAQGRNELAQHPVGSALEVVPGLDVAGDISKVATGPAEEGSSLEALQQHRPLAAAARAIPAGKMETAIGAIEKANLADRMGQMSEALGIDKPLREFSRQRSILARSARSRMAEILNQVADRMGKASPEEFKRIFDLSTGVEAAKLAKFDPHDPAVLGKDNAAIMELRKLQEEDLQRKVASGSMVKITHDGADYYYPATSQMARHMGKVDAAEARVAELGQRTPPTDPAEKLRYDSQLKGAQQKLIKLKRKTARVLTQDLPANLHDFAEQRTRTTLENEVNKVIQGSKEADPQVEQFIRSSYQADQIKSLTHDIQTSTSWQDFARVVGEENFFRIYHSVINETIDLSKHGFDPIYISHVPISTPQEAVFNPKPLSVGYVADRTLKSRTLNFAPHYHDAAIGLASGAREMLSADVSRELVQRAILPNAEPVGSLTRASMKAMADRYADPEVLRNEVARQLNDKFMAYDPSGPFNFKEIRLSSPTDMAVPKYFADGVKKLLNQDGKLEVQGIWDKGLKVYKFSVLTGPRHVVHVAIGGTMFAILQRPTALLRVADAFKMVRDKAIPDEVPQQIYDQPGDHLYEFSSGKTVGRILSTIPNALKHFEEFAANMQRAAVFLDAAKSGMDVEGAALEASKVFVNLDDMVPLERTVIKNWMPFYAFTKHLFSYLFTYPVDHPVRAAVLSRFAEQEQQDWNSGLPKQMQQLFFLGSGPNQTAVDFKSINPFRSFGNDFSIAGIISGMNPVLEAGTTMIGVNPLTATPELYPQVSYDSQTGSLTADRPHSGDWPGVLLESFAPPTQAIDHFIGFTDRLRNLKNSNPEAFRRQLFSSLNIPFDWANVNIPLAQEKDEIHRFQAAQQAVSTGTKTGAFGEAQRFNLVPYQGQLVDPRALSQYWDQLLAQLHVQPGVSAKAVLPKKTTRRRPA